MPRIAIAEGKYHQYLNTRGFITHLIPGMNSPEATFALDLARRQQTLGYRTQLISFELQTPQSKDGSMSRIVTPFNDLSLPVTEFGFANPRSWLTDDSAHLSPYFWDRVLPSQGIENPSIVHLHGEQMGLIGANRPDEVSIPTLLTFFREPADAEAAEAAIGGCDLTFFLSKYQMTEYSQQYRTLASIPRKLLSQVGYLGTDWNPNVEGRGGLPASYLGRLHSEYYGAVFGSGIEQAIDMLNTDPESAYLLYINQDFDRISRAWTQLRGNPVIRRTFHDITAFGWGVEPDPGLESYLRTLPDSYTYTLPTMMFLIQEAAKRLSESTPVVVGINDIGLSTRAIPPVLVALGSKGLLPLGPLTINEIVAREADVILKQLSPGQKIVLIASDNICGGRYTVGTHPLSEDNHGIVNVTLPVTVNNLPANTENLGAWYLHPETGGGVYFGEKLPRGVVTDLANRLSGGVVNLNSMIKIIDGEIARLMVDREHYGRPSYIDPQKPLIEAYAEDHVDQTDWSKHFDEPAVHSVTLDRWMQRWEDLRAAKDPDGIPHPKTAYHRGDWRLLWAVSNDVVLESLQKIAFTEKFFGRFEPYTESDWASINSACISMLKESATFLSDEQIPEDWFFERSPAHSLKANWKELFLAAMYIKNAFAEPSAAEAEWEGRKPADISTDKWMALYEASLKLDSEDNGIAGARTDGVWIDAGERPQYCQAFRNLVADGSNLQYFVRRLSGIEPEIKVENGVSGQEHLVFDPHNNIYVGEHSVFSCPNGGKIRLGNYVVITGKSAITWTGKGTLVIPDNTIIWGSSIFDIDPLVQSNRMKLIFNYHQRQGEVFDIEGLSGPRQIKFGFYGGLCWVTFHLEDGTAPTTMYPLSLNVKGRPDLNLMDDISDVDIRHHFREYFSAETEPIKKQLPFVGLTAAEILQRIRR